MTLPACYDFKHRALNAADYGVPQARPRLFIIGVRKGGRIPELPEATHGGLWERRASGNGAQPHVTAGEELKGLVTGPEPSKVVRGNWGYLLPGIPPGDNYLHYTAAGGHPEPHFSYRSRYWSFP